MQDKVLSSNKATPGMQQTAGYLHLGCLLCMAMETLGFDGLQALGLLLMGEQQAARLGQSLPTLLCLLNCQCLHHILTLTLKISQSHSQSQAQGQSMPAQYTHTHNHTHSHTHTHNCNLRHSHSHSLHYTVPFPVPAPVSISVPVTHIVTVAVTVPVTYRYSQYSHYRRHRAAWTTHVVEGADQHLKYACTGVSADIHACPCIAEHMLYIKETRMYHVLRRNFTSTTGYNMYTSENPKPPAVLHDAVSCSAVSSISNTAYIQAGIWKLDMSVPSRQELPQLPPQLHPCVPQRHAAARQLLLPCHCQARTWRPGLQWCCCAQPRCDQI